MPCAGPLKALGLAANAPFPFFRALLGSQKNREEDTEISQIYLVPTHMEPPHHECPTSDSIFVTKHEPTLTHLNHPES